MAVAIVSAGIGGAAASVIAAPRPVHVEHRRFAAGGGATPGLPAGNAPTGSVEQVAAKVVPSVVMLETNLGRQSEEGSGIILSADGLILTNNHVVATAANPAKPPRRTSARAEAGRERSRRPGARPRPLPEPSRRRR